LLGLKESQEIVRESVWPTPVPYDLGPGELAVYWRQASSEDAYLYVGNSYVLDE
jgi:hypothetical protein